MVREAGGTVTDMLGGEFSLRGEHVLADNTLIHEETVTLFTDVFSGRYVHALPEIGR